MSKPSLALSQLRLLDSDDRESVVPAVDSEYVLPSNVLEDAVVANRPAMVSTN
jgi:hypothetical protein